MDLDGGGWPTEGAQVSVRCGDLTLLRQHDAGAGFLSQNSATLHFGLGGCAQVEGFDVLWPDGQEETFPGTAADQRVTLTRGSAEVTAARPLRTRNFNIDQRPGLTGDLSAPAPAVRFAAFEDGAPLDLQAAGDGVTVLNFWATWCIPCVAEMPDLVQLESAYRAKGVAFYGVTMDTRDNAGAVREFLDRFGVDYPQVWGDAESMAPFASLASVPNGSIPMTVVLKDDVVRSITAGQIQRETLGQLLEALAGE